MGLQFKSDAKIVYLEEVYRYMQNVMYFVCLTSKLCQLTCSKYSSSLRHAEQKKLQVGLRWLASHSHVLAAGIWNS